MNGIVEGKDTSGRTVYWIVVAGKYVDWSYSEDMMRGVLRNMLASK